MSEYQANQNSRKWRYLLLLLLLILICGFLFSRCSKQAIPTEMVTTEQAAAEPILHGTFTFSSGVSQPQRVEYWYQNQLYRLTWFNEDGSIRMHMISPDGTTHYLSNVAEQTTRRGYMAPEMYHTLFGQPQGFESESQSEADGASIITYTFNKLWEFEGAAQTFYLKDMQVYEKDGVRSKVITRTASTLQTDENELITSEYVFAEPATPELESTESVFELPF